MKRAMLVATMFFLTASNSWAVKLIVSTPCPVTVLDPIRLVLESKEPPSRLFRYNYYFRPQGQSVGLIAQTTDKRVVFTPHFASSYQFGVAFGPNPPTEWTAPCLVNSITFTPAVGVSPQSGQAVAPPMTAAQALTIGVTNPTQASMTSKFDIYFTSADVSKHYSKTTTEKSVTWTEPGLPDRAGTYTISVFVRGYEANPNITIAEGSKTISGYVVTPNPAVADPTYPFGWIHYITVQNTTEPVSTPIGSASNVIAGHSVKDIVSDPNIRVRADNRACASCHSTSWSDKATFCSHVPNFVSNQGTHANDTILKNLFNNWKSRACPE